MKPSKWSGSGVYTLLSTPFRLSLSSTSLADPVTEGVLSGGDAGWEGVLLDAKGTSPRYRMLRLGQEAVGDPVEGTSGQYLVDVAGFGDSVRFETLAGVEIRRGALLR